MSTLGNNLFAQYYAQNQGLPFGYEAVEYLDTTGFWPLDTGVTMSSDLVIDGWGQNKYRSSSFIRGFIHDTNTIWSIFVISSGSQPNIQGAFNSAGPLNLHIDNIAFDSWFHFNLSNRRLEVNGVVNKTSQKYNIPVTDTRMYIGGVFADNNPQDYLYYPAVVGKLRMYKGTALVRDFVPCVKQSNGKHGLYDLCRSTCALTNTPFYTMNEYTP